MSEKEDKAPSVQGEKEKKFDSQKKEQKYDSSKTNKKNFQTTSTRKVQSNVAYSKESKSVVSADNRSSTSTSGSNPNNVSRDRKPRNTKTTNTRVNVGNIPNKFSPNTKMNPNSNNYQNRKQNTKFPNNNTNNNNKDNNNTKKPLNSPHVFPPRGNDASKVSDTPTTPLSPTPSIPLNAKVMTLDDFESTLSNTNTDNNNKNIPTSEPISVDAIEQLLESSKEAKSRDTTDTKTKDNSLIELLESSSHVTVKNDEPISLFPNNNNKDNNNNNSEKRYNNKQNNKEEITELTPQVIHEHDKIAYLSISDTPLQITNKDGSISVFAI
ncbi:hypothetical protein WA158_007600 [Blastocystis sp. Blastoise]